MSAIVKKPSCDECIHSEVCGIKKSLRSMFTDIDHSVILKHGAGTILELDIRCLKENPCERAGDENEN